MSDIIPFHLLRSSIGSINLPERFTFPFNYQAHELCIEAARDVQSNLDVWGCGPDFKGKMFGVLIVKTVDDKLGYLAAYSGNNIDVFADNYFVNPIFDPTVEGGYFRCGENELIEINRVIGKLENADAMLTLKSKMFETQQSADDALRAYKSLMKSNKKTRKAKRIQLEENMSGDSLISALEELNKQSVSDKNALRQLKKDWSVILEKVQVQLTVLVDEIQELKAQRKEKSSALQQWLFDQYQLLNIKGERKGLCDIFAEAINAVPPAAAGDCAAPRLLQAAFQNNMKPLAMAEFWWGQSPDTMIRQHGNFYPSCTSKCKPILGHMLDGMLIDPDPLQNNVEDLELDVIFEDSCMIVVNKAAGVLSVPGKGNVVSVYDLVLQMNPDAQVVHRLDMPTSGILVFAKSLAMHKLLQEQFISRQAKKRYVALLDGIVDEDSGTIELPLRVDLDNRPSQMVCYEHGKPAKTQWRVISRENGRTRIHFFPITGRSHQLRMHAAHLSGLHCPIVGDNLYGKTAERLCLHAERLEIRHPATGKKMVFECTAEF